MAIDDITLISHIYTFYLINIRNEGTVMKKYLNFLLKKKKNFQKPSYIKYLQIDNSIIISKLLFILNGIY